MMEVTADTFVEHGNRLSRCAAWGRSPECSVYFTKLLQSWGDRMWGFAVGLYLVKLSQDSLRLTAIYGLTNGVCVILLGALIGDWVDRTKRLTVARLSLVVQNLAVIICAIILCLVLGFYQQITASLGGHLAHFCHSLIIGTAVVSKLASIATKIAIEKDWVVVMCAGDKVKLANMNVIMRRIDLTTNILAPVVVGQVMTFVSMMAGAVLIAAWNLMSMFLEYYFLWRIYVAFPDLAVKAWIKKPAAKRESKSMLISPSRSSIVKTDREVSDNLNSRTVIEDESVIKPKKSCTGLVFSRFITLYRGWKTYMTQPVLPAGLAYACEFFTVLAFDNITTGYAYSQGLSEALLGGLMAAGAVTGILGTFVYPISRKRIGIERTGISAFLIFLACLVFCVVSIWAPGSPFDPTFSRSHGGVPNKLVIDFTACENDTNVSDLQYVSNGTTLLDNEPDYNGKINETVNLQTKNHSQFPVMNKNQTNTHDIVKNLTIPENSSHDLVSLETKNETINMNDTYKDITVNNYSHVDKVKRSNYLKISPIFTISSNHIADSIMFLTDENSDWPSFYLNDINQKRNLNKRGISFVSMNDNEHNATNNLAIIGDSNVSYEIIPSGNTEIEYNGTIMTIDETLSDLCQANKSGNVSYIPNSYISIALLMSGIVMARFGLWLSDLTINQIFQENVAENERGTVGGVQSSMNMLMDVFRFIMVVIVPYPETYGILIIISFASICLGFMTFSYYARKSQGYFCFASRRPMVDSPGTTRTLEDGTPVTEL